jgi:hypothetical protein
METAIDFLKLSLKEKGYNGLCCTEVPCGCSLDDFMPCGEFCNLRECRPAYKTVCNGETCECQCDSYNPGGECFTLIKPENKEN